MLSKLEKHLQCGYSVDFKGLFQATSILQLCNISVSPYMLNHGFHHVSRYFPCVSAGPKHTANVVSKAIAVLQDVILKTNSTQHSTESRWKMTINYKGKLMSKSEHEKKQ